MKKAVLLIALWLGYAPLAAAEGVNMQQLDSAIRAAQPSTNSIMYRRNANEYRSLSAEQKAEIERQREEMRRKAEEYARKKAEYERYQAQMEAQRRAEEEAARKRAEELKPITLYGGKLKIYALVNGELITSTDMQSRINAFILTTGIPYNAKTKTMITNRVLQGAIDEKLKLQEAKKNNIIVSRKEINQAVANFEKANGMKQGQLRQILAQGNVQMSVWTGQIESDLAWRKLVAQKGRSYAVVGENDINRAFEDIRKDMKTQKYMVSEIVVNKKDAKDLTPLAEVLRQDPRFELYAMQFSQSPSAPNGGHLGWVLKGRLPQPLENAVLKLKEGGVTNPILYGNDYYILKLEKIFNPQTDAGKLPSKRDVKTYLENKKMEEFSIKYMKDLRNKALIEKKI
ncbi:MAG: peptidylprolyl isomerase [Alphaproteobacteria bacterium]|nr:peptidylprolyl isomerase [Alphaproteobacteria bacterium]